MVTAKKDQPLALAPESKVEIVPGRSLHRKLAQIMWEAERIPKNGVGPKEQGSYPFVQVGDAADYIRKALAEQVITMMPTSVQVVGQADRPTSKGGTMTTVDLLTEWTLTDGESGESITIMAFGAGADTGDKYSGKATTSAMKYALLSGFLLSTGDDVENADTSDQLQPARPEDEKAELLGNIQKSGKVEKGTAEGYKLEWRETSEGHAIGFRVKLDGDDRAIPQVLVMGAIGQALYLVTTGDALLGQRISFKGKLYNIRQAPPRQSYYRLVIGEAPTTDFIETPDVRIPALVDEVEPVAPTEVVPVAMFPDGTPGPDADEEAAILAAEMAEAAAG